MTERDYDIIIKLLLVGDSSVGKSSIMCRFSGDDFNASYISTIGIDLKYKIIELNGKKIKLQIWDTISKILAGQERYRTITKNYYRGAMGVILVYDTTSVKTFDSVSQWLKQIQEEAPEDVVKMLVGNKCDLIDQRAIEKERGVEVANGHQIQFFETSAKTNLNVDEAFYRVTEEILNKLSNKIEDKNKNEEEPVQLHAQRQKRFGCC